LPLETRRDIADASAWWAVDAVLLRFLEDFIDAELKILRPGTWSYGIASPWHLALDFRRDLGVDSLELFTIASSLAEALHLSESGIEDYLLARQTLADWAEIAQTSLRQYSQRITFRTSGSTGKPKSCTHALETLEQEITELVPHFADCTRIVSAVPSHHIYGFLFTVLLPRRLNIAEMPVLNVRRSSPASLRVLHAGDLVVGHPEFWRNVARVAIRIPSGVSGVTSTGPLPDGISGELTKLGLTRLLQVYGSSESAGIGWRDNERRGYRLFSYWQRLGADSIIRSLPDGQRGRSTVQDHLEWLSNDEFLPLARIDLAVQVGGINVYPAHVRDVLLKHPQVADVAVRLMSADEGNRLKAFIVAKGDDVELLQLRVEIDAWAVRHLSTAEIPRALSFGNALPRDDQGKLVDWVIDGR